jgi:hypothetical protein
MQEPLDGLQILFLAAYGERPTRSEEIQIFNTPITFGDALCLDIATLRLPKSEYEELIFNYNETQCGKLISISKGKINCGYILY